MGDRLLLWAVQEFDRVEYACAYPPTGLAEDRGFSDKLAAFIESHLPDASCDLTDDPIPTVEVLGR